MSRMSSEDRRAQIGRAMLELMAEHGYADASMQRLAERADITQGLIHYHFANKRKILLYVLDMLVERQLAALRAVLGDEPSAPDALRAVVELFLATGERARPKDVAVWIVIGAEATRDASVRRRFVRALRAFADPLEQILRDGVASGELGTRGQSIEACVAAILAVIQGYYTIAAVDRALVPEGSAASATWRMITGLLALRTGEDDG